MEEEEHKFKIAASVPPSNCQCVQLEEMQPNDLEKAEAFHVNAVKPNVLCISSKKGRVRKEMQPKRKYCNQQPTLKAKDGVINPPYIFPT